MTCEILILKSLRMHFSKADKPQLQNLRKGVDARDLTQLGLDFATPAKYSEPLKKGADSMNHELLELLENKLNELLEKHALLKVEADRLREENRLFATEREGLKSRVDSMLEKLTAI